MEAHRFDTLARSLVTASTRRTVAGALGGLVLLGALPVGARQGKKKPKTNAFGCVDVGKACAGKDGACCSGVCQGKGKKPKKKRKDKSTCVAHNAGACTLDSCAGVGDIPCNPANPQCFCVVTTGKANFCGNFTTPVTNHCRVCSKDTHCEAEFGTGAACIVFAGICAPLCPATGGTGCVPACV